MGEFVDNFIDHHDILPIDEQLKLVEKAQAGDVQARNDVILSNLRLIRKEAQHFSTKTNMEFDDLFQEGMLGCSQAIIKYDLKDSSKNLTSFMVLHIRKAIIDYINNHSNLIRIPVYKLNIFRKIEKAIRKIYNGNESSLNPKEIADSIGEKESNVLEYLIYQNEKNISLNAPVSEKDSESREVIENLMLGDPNELEKMILNEDKLNTVKEIINTKIKGLDQEIIKRKLGLEDFEEMSIIEICFDLHVTRKEVRQSLSKSYKIIRNMMTD